MSRIDEIKSRLDENAYAYGGEALVQEDISYLLAALDRPQDWWQLYDQFENKIAEKLQLKDKLEEEVTRHKQTIYELTVAELKLSKTLQATWNEDALKMLTNALAWTNDRREDITDRERLEQIHELLVTIIP